MGIDKMMEAISSLKETATVEKVYGPAQTIGERTIIPVAEVMYKFCMGFGKGKPRRAEPAAAEGEEGEGAGGGGGVRARPVAVLEVTPTGMQVVPIVDVTRMALAGILMGTAAVCMTGRYLMKMAYFKHHQEKMMKMAWLKHKAKSDKECE